MNILNIFFYLFSGMLTLSSLGVILAANPVYSLLWLIFSFCNAAGLFVLFGAEYLAMTLIIVYVGAVAVLFLFVIMMLNIDVAEMKKQLKRHILLGLIVTLAFFINISIILYCSFGDFEEMHFNKSYRAFVPKIPHDYQNIGEVLYTEYVVPFQIAGAILLASMLGCIVLTLTHNTNNKKQDPYKQISRKPEDCMNIVKVQKGVGIDI